MLVNLANKKGMSNETLVLFIVTLGLMVGLLFLNKGVGEASDKAAVVTACKASVDRNARLHIGGIDFPTRINCPAREIKITKAGSPEANEKANRIIADAMYDCWYQYGEGKLNLFSDEATFCAVCSFINIKAAEPVTGLTYYLMTEQLPDRSGRLYHDYLASYKTAKAEDVLGKIQNKPFLTELGQHELKAESDYAIVIVYTKGIDELKRIARHILAQSTESKAGYMIGVFGGGLAGAGAFVTLATIGVAAGPAGWVALGVGVTVIGIASGIAFLFSGDAPPEWASYIVLREWNADETTNILKDELGCTYYPTKLE